MEVVNEKTPQYPNNVRRTMYEINIAEIGKRIARLEESNRELVEEASHIESATVRTDMETANHIAELNRLLSIQQKKIDESQNAIDILERQRLQETKESVDEQNYLEQQYEDTKLKLLSKIKILHAKINVLEDFKNNRSALEIKLENNEELMVQKEEDLKKRINQLNIKFRVDREKLIKELHEQLFKLSGTWAIESANRKSIAIRRLLQENIIMAYELGRYRWQMHEDNVLCSEFKEIQRARQKNGLNYQCQRDEKLAIMKIQKKLIKELVEGREAAKKDDPVIFSCKAEFLKYDSRLDKLWSDILLKKQEIANLTFKLYKSNVKVKVAKSSTEKSDRKVTECIEKLYDVKYAVACALQFIDTGPDIATMTETTLIAHLNNLIGP